MCSFYSQFLDIGIVTSVEVNHKQVESARKGQEVCIKIEPIPGESPKMFGRHFDEKDMLVSKVSFIELILALISPIGLGMMADHSCRLIGAHFEHRQSNLHR